MSRYSVAEAKDGLPSLINKALAGEEVVITRRGKEVVEIRARQISAVQDARKWDSWLDERRAAWPQIRGGQTSVELLDQVYEDYPY